MINLEGVVYTGEYDLAAADGYLPGEWKPGDRIPIRLEGEKLFFAGPMAANWKPALSNESARNEFSS